MKFLFVAPRLHPNFQYQILALKEGGHDIEFFAIHSARGEENNFVAPRVFGYSRIFNFFNNIFSKPNTKLTRSRFQLTYGIPPVLEFFHAVRRSEADVIIIKNIASAYSVLALITGLLLGKKLIVFMSIEKYRPKPISWSVYAVGIIFGAKVITPLEGDEKYKNFNKNLFFVPLPHPVENGFEKDYVKDGRVQVVCVGKFSKRKDQLLLLKAIDQLRVKYDLTVTLIGLRDEGEYLLKIKEFIEKKGLEKIVSIKYDLSWKRVYEEYKQHDIFVLPSFNELHSFAAIEAMSCGLPVIVSDDNGIKWYVKNGENGYVFKRGNIEDLVQVLEDSLKVGEIERMGRNALGKVSETCSLELYRDNILKLLLS